MPSASTCTPSLVGCAPARERGGRSAGESKAAGGGGAAARARLPEQLSRCPRPRPHQSPRACCGGTEHSLQSPRAAAHTRRVNRGFTLHSTPATRSRHRPAPLSPAPSSSLPIPSSSLTLPLPSHAPPPLLAHHTTFNLGLLSPSRLFAASIAIGACARAAHVSHVTWRLGGGAPAPAPLVRLHPPSPPKPETLIERGVERGG
eukprot:2598321-Rhodomonas_salina.1